MSWDRAVNTTPVYQVGEGLVKVRPCDDVVAASKCGIFRSQKAFVYTDHTRRNHGLPVSLYDDGGTKNLAFPSGNRSNMCQSLSTRAFEGSRQMVTWAANE